MGTPFQDFVNVELPKRVYTMEPSNSWTAGKALVTTGQGLGVQAIDYSWGAVSGEWDMTSVGGTENFPTDVVGGPPANIVPFPIVANGPYGARPYSIVPPSSAPSGITICASSSTAYTIGSTAVAQFNNYASTASDPYLIWFGFMNAEMSSTDLISALNGSTPLTASLVFAGSIAVGVDNTYEYVLLSTGGAVFGNVTDNQAHTVGQLVQFKLEQSGPSLRLMAKVSTDTIFRMVCEGPASDAPTGMKPYIAAVYLLPTPVTVIDNITLGGDPGIVTAPVDPEGKRYLVSVGGVFNGEAAEAGDIAEFLTPTDIFVTRDVNVVLASLPTLDQVSAIEGSVTSLDGRVGSAEESITILQGQMADVFKDGRLPVENLVGASETTFEYFLGSTNISTAQADQKQYKVFTWDNAVDVTDYAVDFYRTPDSGEHFFLFKIVMPYSNNDLTPLQRRVRIRSASLDAGNSFGQPLEDIVVDAYKLKEVHGVYEAGAIRFTGYYSTTAPTVFVPDRNPAVARSESVATLVDGPSSWYAGSSCVEKLTVTGAGTFAMILHYVDVSVGGLLPFLKESTLHLTLIGDATGITGISIDGISIPDVPPSETHFYTYSPRLGCLTRTVS
jgi:hypothetical protein